MMVLVIYLSTTHFNQFNWKLNEQSNERWKKRSFFVLFLFGIWPTFHWFSSIWKWCVSVGGGKYENWIEPINNFVVLNLTNIPHFHYLKCGKKWAKQSWMSQTNIKNYTSQNRVRAHAQHIEQTSVFPKPFKFILTLLIIFYFLRDFARFSNFPRSLSK